MTALEQLVELSREPLNQAVQGHKEGGGRVIGFICSYLPEEIIHAAGMLPYRISPTGCSETADADAYLSRLNCTFARGCLQFAMEGKFDFLDGLVGINPCDHIRRLWDLWRLKGGAPPYTRMLSLPHRTGEGAVKWYLEEVAGFKDSLEESFGVKITDEKLRASIRLYNKTRELVKSIYALRERQKPPISASDLLAVMVAVMHTPKELCNDLLAKLLSELEAGPGIGDYKARLMVAGGECDNPEFMRVIEDLGGLVVADSLCFGSRYFSAPVPTEGDPLLSLVTAYLQRPLCASMVGGQQERLDYILEQVKRYRVDGIIFQKLRWCDLWGGERFFVAQSLKKAGVPLLDVEREYWLSGAEQLKTRVQAFLEVIES